MKQPRRWAAWLAAILIAASLVGMPRRGAATPPFIDDLPPPVNEGDPDVPYGVAARHVERGPILTVGHISIVFLPETRTFFVRSAWSRPTSHFLRRGELK